jgi:hypothetical protein
MAITPDANHYRTKDTAAPWAFEPADRTADTDSEIPADHAQPKHAAPPADETPPHHPQAKP